MLRTSFRIAWRTLRKRAFYTGIEVVGLAVGLTCFTLTALYIQHELSYDRFFRQSDATYRVIHVETGSGNRYSGTASALGSHARRELAGVTDVVRVWSPYRMFDTSVLVERNPDVRFYEDNGLVADSSFFRLFDFQVVDGDIRRALRAPNAVVLSRRMAEKYFGTERAVGQVLRLNHDQPLTVTAVVEVPTNTHLAFDFLRPAHHNPAQEYVWEHTVAFTYLRVDRPEAIASVEKGLYQIVLNNTRTHQIDYLKNYHHRLQPLREVHTTVLNWDVITAVSTRQLGAVGVLAGFILLLGMVNFVNLATARSAERVREVGMNKILGANRWQLQGRYLGESLVISLLAGALAALLIPVLLPVFNQLVGGNLTLPTLLTVANLLTYLLFLGLVGGLAGLYPSYVLTRFEPHQLVRRSFTRTPGQAFLRQGLVVAQFVITMVLLVGTFVVQRQIQFMQESSLGFDKDQVLVARFQRPDYGQFQRLKNEWQRHSGVLGVAGASIPLGAEPGSSTFRTPAMPHETPQNFAKTMCVDPAFLPLMGIPLVQGRNFNPGAADQGATYLVNETAVRRFQLKNPLATPFGRFDQEPARIVGVVRDFHFAGLTSRIDPLVLSVDSVQSHRYAFVKLKAGQVAQALTHVRRAWEAVLPEFPPEFFFQDDYFNRVYQQQEQVRRLLGLFTGLALGLACLGLFGLSSFMTIRRTKEIGVRKVLGASVVSIIRLLSTDFLRLVLIAILIASPLAWYVMNEWLNDFVYKISLEWWVFALAGLLVVGIALLTVSFQSVKAALMNPVKSLRTE